MMAASIITTKGLCKKFSGAERGSEITVLNDINLSVEKGEIFGIIGRSGAGKSTLVRCINYLETPSAGDVVFDGISMSGLSRRELYKTRQSIGMIFQQFNLLMQRNALGNVLFPMEIAGVPRGEAKAKATELLSLVGLEDKLKSYPAQLSGGQRQRVAIARAIALMPKALLCDEATSALDPETTSSILTLLKDINKRFGITIVIITHEMSVIEQVADRVAILDRSQIAEIGTVSSVFTRPKSEVTKRLVYPDGETDLEAMKGGDLVRIVFNGNSSFEPVIADMVMRFRRKVNIMHADTRDVGGKAFGQMILQLPVDAVVSGAMREYLSKRGLSLEDVSASGAGETGKGQGNE
jgi:D-methionine transport system ATP-binding protein